MVDLGFPGGSVVKNLPVVQQTQVRSLSREDPLEEGMVCASSSLAFCMMYSAHMLNKQGDNI